MSIIVPTDDPGKTEAEYRAQGWIPANLYAAPFYQRYCEGRRWAIQFWKPEQPEQRELI